MRKTVFITGATSGIGLVTAQKLHQLSWDVYAGGLPTDDFSILDEDIKAIPFDLNVSDTIEATVNILKNELDHLDALVNCAGIQISSPLEALPVESLRRQFEVNVFGHFQLIQALLPLIRQSNSGRIVNLSSLMGRVPMPMLGAYSMSKHALEAMSDVMRMELSQFGIHLAIIQMGAIDTPMTAQALQDLDAARDASSADIRAKYKNHFDAMAKTLQSQGKNASSPEKVTKAILHALTSDKPKAHYTIGLEVQGLFTIRKILPDRLFDRFLQRILGIK